MDRITRITMHGAAALLASAAVCAPASARQSEGACGGGALSDGGAVLSVVAARSDEKAEHRWSDGKNELRILRDGGRVRVYLNGDEVFDLTEDLAPSTDEARRLGETARMMARELRQRFGQDFPNAPAPPLPPGPPRVMIGVTLESGSAVEGGLPGGVDGDRVTLISRVVEGLPAHEAGVREGDIVVAVNGEPGASPDEIRQKIRAMKPGEDLKLKVLRNGEEKELSVRLEAYDGERLGAPRGWGFRSADGQGLFSGETGQRLAELRERLAKHAAEMAELGSRLSVAEEKARVELSARMADLGKVIGEMAGEVARLAAREGIPSLGFLSEQFPGLRIAPGDGDSPRAFVFTPAPPGSERDQRGADRMRRLDERLDRLESLIERLERHLNEQKN